MKYHFGKIIVLGLGGSIFYPEELDISFLKKFRDFIRPFLKKKKIILVVGGGRLARFYQSAAAAINTVSDTDKDWLGIYATRLNAQLWRTCLAVDSTSSSRRRTVFKKEADPAVIEKKPVSKKLKYDLTIASGWMPGWSTDYIAVALAKHFGASEVILAGKPDYVYNKDNHLYTDAKPFFEISWRQYRKMAPKKWRPGFNIPVDSVAARLAAYSKIKAIVVKGDNFANFRRLLTGKSFKGTIIS